MGLSWEDHDAMLKIAGVGTELFEDEEFAHSVLGVMELGAVEASDGKLLQAYLTKRGLHPVLARVLGIYYVAGLNHGFMKSGRDAAPPGPEEEALMYRWMLRCDCGATFTGLETWEVDSEATHHVHNAINDELLEEYPTLVGVLGREGYVRASGEFESGEGPRIDARIARLSRCPVDHQRRRYEGYVRDDGHAGYRALAVCPNGHAEEF